MRLLTLVLCSAGTIGAAQEYRDRLPRDLSTYDEVSSCEDPTLAMDMEDALGLDEPLFCALEAVGVRATHVWTNTAEPGASPVNLEDARFVRAETDGGGAMILQFDKRDQRTGQLVAVSDEAITHRLILSRFGFPFLVQLTGAYPVDLEDIGIARDLAPIPGWTTGPAAYPGYANRTRVFEVPSTSCEAFALLPSPFSNVPPDAIGDPHVFRSDDGRNIACDLEDAGHLVTGIWQNLAFSPVPANVMVRMQLNSGDEVVLSMRQFWRDRRALVERIEGLGGVAPGWDDPDGFNGEFRGDVDIPGALLGRASFDFARIGARIENAAEFPSIAAIRVAIQAELPAILALRPGHMPVMAYAEGGQYHHGGLAGSGVLHTPLCRMEAEVASCTWQTRVTVTEPGMGVTLVSGNTGVMAPVRFKREGETWRMADPAEAERFITLIPQQNSTQRHDPACDGTAFMPAHIGIALGC